MRYQGPGPSDWCLFTKEYLENPLNLNILYIKYEELKKDTSHTISRLNNFLGYPDMAEEEIDEIIELTSYDKMKKTHSEVHSTTQGVSGAHKVKLSDANITAINGKITEFVETGIDDKGLGLEAYVLY